MSCTRVRDEGVLYSITRILTLTSFITLHRTSRCRFMLTRRSCIILNITRRVRVRPFARAEATLEREQSSFVPDRSHIIIQEGLTGLNARLNRDITTTLPRSAPSGFLRALFAGRKSVVMHDKRSNAAPIQRLKFG